VPVGANTELRFIIYRNGSGNVLQEQMSQSPWQLCE
jgi:hypothetical protein